MATSVEKTLNYELCEKGYETLRIIKNAQLPEDLSGVMLDYARGKYTDVRVVPAEIALAGSHLLPRDPSHVVYVKYNERHPSYEDKEHRVRILFFEAEDPKTGEILDGRL